ncbi:hypothetical protein GQ44DRAFT_711585 [Phaeosphaeriaceae sp. PMI808]|nr:hypothetical protein GQ44DRAFT_711585 [Phaeosphaeriaceae sp. PMI808]
MASSLDSCIFKQATIEYDAIQRKAQSRCRANISDCSDCVNVSTSVTNCAYPCKCSALIVSTYAGCFWMCQAVHVSNYWLQTLSSNLLDCWCNKTVICRSCG